MPKSVFGGVRISGVAGAVPKNAVNNLTDHEFCPVEDRKKIIALTKVASYRKAPAEICASDLCLAAAETLLAGLRRKPEEIDAIVFATHNAGLSRPVDRLCAPAPAELPHHRGRVRHQHGLLGVRCRPVQRLQPDQGGRAEARAAAGGRHPDQAVLREGQECGLHPRGRRHRHASGGGRGCRRSRGRADDGRGAFREPVRPGGRVSPARRPTRPGRCGSRPTAACAPTTICT